ncbi:hypothetical protein MLB1_04260 [Mycobacteroides sp. LB1]|nr:hypothetical protein [Mycobacteroides sp. LB1]
MGDDGWKGKRHQPIADQLSAVNPAAVQAAGKKWTTIGEKVDSANRYLKAARDRMDDPDFWTGKGPEAAQDKLDRGYKAAVPPADLAKKIGDGLDEDSKILQGAKAVAANNPEPQYPQIPGNLPPIGQSALVAQYEADRLAKLAKIQHEAQTFYTDALMRKRPSMLDQLGGIEKPPPGFPPSGGRSDGAGGGDTGGANGYPQKPASPGDTKPASNEGAGAGEGQGGSQGSGQGSGAGGGNPAGGGTGGGSGAGSGLGTDPKGGSGYSPYGGNTTAAGYSPTSAAGTGTGAGPGALRAGGLPSGAGAGTGGAGSGAGGTSGRGGGFGMGGMGMAPMGAHGARGKGEDDDEHELPSYLVNMDNGSELFGNLPKASPGVIGDWSEHDEAEKRREEAEIRRYKSMGWNVKYQ